LFQEFDIEPHPKNSLELNVVESVIVSVFEQPQHATIPLAQTRDVDRYLPNLCEPLSRMRPHRGYAGARLDDNAVGARCKPILDPGTYFLMK
jgi:hypothetical protein